ncbi:MAG: DUF4135 domain-containing protein [Eggerthellaceae bacterium]|nr:DUF4135 domain-containing protein [Eggerthellaceae bacterium]
MLADKVYERLEGALRRKVAFITDSTVTHMVAQAVAADNPFAAAIPGLLTNQDRERGLASVRQQVESGALKLPEPLVERLELQLGYVTDAFLEALARLEENQDAICNALLDGRRFQVIEDVGLSAGDTHNRGRSVTIFHTDAGTLVYKPHDLRAEGRLREFARAC